LQTGRWRARNAAVAQAHRMNVGAIIESEMLDVRLAVRAGVRARPGVARGQGPLPLVAGQRLGQIEQYFIEGLTPGDTFLFAGQILKLLGVREADALVVRASDDNPSIPSYAGGKFPLSTFLADRVRQLIHDPKRHKKLPQQVRDWIKVQKRRSVVPAPHEMLVETFPRGTKHYLVCYPFEGRLAHQTLGMLLSRRLERTGKKPLGFLASEYAVAVWALEPMGDVDLAGLFDEDMLGDDLESWLAESTLMKSMFGKCAMIAGMIQRNAPAAARKTSRQVTFSSDLIYDVLRRHQPDHVLLRATRADAASGLVDVARLAATLKRAKGNIAHRQLKRVSPLAVPVLLEVGRESVYGAQVDDLLADAAAAEALIAEATAEDDEAQGTLL
jgi:ATP-dependent Lhr-like helicase